MAEQSPAGKPVSNTAFVVTMMVSVVLLSLVALAIAVGMSKGQTLDDAVEHGDQVAACANATPNQPLLTQACIDRLP